jgi:8-oxo-dGTP diphosphatase
MSMKSEHRFPRHIFQYTICFLVKQESVLMLNRHHAPNMGLWNGVGGHIEPDEDPAASMLREITEETGMRFDAVDYRGCVRWLFESRESGMFVFTKQVPETIEYPTPRHFSEGILDWKSISWILDPNNKGGVASIPYFLPAILHEPLSYEHIFIYQNDHICRYDRKRL